MSRALERRGTELARQRAAIHYVDRAGQVQAGTLISWPSARATAGAQARVRNDRGYFVSIDPDRVTLPGGEHYDPRPNPLNPQPVVEVDPQPSTLTRRSRVSVHELGPDGTLIARDVGAPPAPGPSTPHQAGPA